MTLRDSWNFSKAERYNRCLAHVLNSTRRRHTTIGSSSKTMSPISKLKILGLFADLLCRPYRSDIGSIILTDIPSECYYYKLFGFQIPGIEG